MKKLFYYFSVLLLLTYGCSYDESGYFDDTGDSGLMVSGNGNGSGNSNDTLQAGKITAAEWNDLNHWDFWESLTQNAELNDALQTWKFNPYNRYSFQITDAAQAPAIGVTVALFSNQEIIWKAKTDNRGKAELWLDMTQSEQKATTQLGAAIYYDQDTLILDSVMDYNAGVNAIEVPKTLTAPTSVDIHFMVDATGSMSDELEFLKVELLDVIQRINTSNQDYTFRYGSVFYRDIGDSYITKTATFNSDKDVLIDWIKQQSASGGGNYPEAVHTALDHTLNEQNWGENNRTSLCFILLDAPPHEDTQVITDINYYTKQAASMGVKLIPIVASGTNKSTEFLMRFMAIASNGTYVFITDHSGIGEEHMEPTVGEYQVEYLNNLLVRLINQNIE